MNRLGIPRAHLIGYSLGADVGLYLAVHHPEKVATLTTIGTDGVCHPEGAEAFEADALLKNGKHAFIRQMTARHMDAHRGNWQEFLHQSAQDWRRYPTLSEAQLKTIGCPAFFIAGEHDHFAGEEGLKRLHSLVPGSRYWIVPGGTHRPHMAREHPTTVNDVILAFFNGPSDVTGQWMSPAAPKCRCERPPRKVCPR
jgi:pimeloyl-ACP methyl ester carboxylesterase